MSVLHGNLVQITPLTREHAKEVSDLFDPAKSAANTSTNQSGTTGTTTISQLQPVPSIYALGDCCANTDSPLPPLAQVAEQQGKYLAHVLNEEAKNLNPKQEERKQGSKQPYELQPFKYKHLGSMATVGGMSAIIQLGGENSFKIGARRGFSLAGGWSALKYGAKHRSCHQNLSTGCMCNTRTGRL